MLDCSPRTFLIVLVAFSLFLVFFELGRMDVWSDNEGQRAEPPAEMIRSGDYVIPTMNGNPYLAKPPFLYWMIAGVYKITGVITPFTARIPTALSLVVLAVSMYLLLRRGLGESAARWGSMGIVTSQYVLQQARMAGIDVCLMLAVFLAVMGYWQSCAAVSRGKTIGYGVLGGVAFGAAILLKGPVPFLFMFPALIGRWVVAGEHSEDWVAAAAKWTAASLAIGLVLWAVGLVAPGAVPFPVALVLFCVSCVVLAWKRGGGWGCALGPWALVMATGIVVALPWCVAVLHRIGLENAMQLLHSESIDRTYAATRINSGSPLFYLLALPVMAAPWGLLFPCQVSRETWRKSNGLYRYMVLTGWVSVFVFSFIAGKEHKYILPAAPLLVAAAGYQLAQYREDSAGSWGTWVKAWSVFFPALFAVVAAGGMVYLAIKLRYPVMLIEAGVLVAGVLCLGWVALKRPGVRLQLIPFMAGLVLLTVFVSQSFYYTGRNSFKDVAAVTGNLIRAGNNVEAIKMTSAYDVFPAFAFYAAVTVPTIKDPAAARDVVRQKFEGDRPYYCAISMKQLRVGKDKRPAREALDDFLGQMGISKKPSVMGPYTSKEIFLLGNGPLPGAR